jgi:GNAT superfamily N-acetyltransferase
MIVRELNNTDGVLFKTIRLQALTSDPDAFGETLDSARLRTDAQWEARLAEILDGQGTVFLAQEGETPIGMCVMSEDATDKKAAFMFGVFVDSEYRKSGVGSALLQASESWARKRGYLTIRANVAAPNEVAITFYKSIGYSIDAQVGLLRPGSQIPVFRIHKDFA